MDKVIKSRKFWAAIAAHQMLQNAIYTLIAYILGTGLEGFRKPA